MKLISKKVTWFLLLICSFANAQMDKYTYKRELIGVSNSWNKFTLPEDIFDKVQPNLFDIRIFEISNKQDTTEAPYLIRLMEDRITSIDVDFKIINKSFNKNGYYFTFEVPLNKTINQIILDFEETNFDWKIKLEGSQNQTQWFTILNNYRILSIQNEITDYQFTKLVFPTSNYKFFRVLVKTNNKPNLSRAKISEKTVSKGTLKLYQNKKINIKENRKEKQTEIIIELFHAVPISQLKIKVKDTIDFYRSITIKYLTDSVKTEQGWKYSYTTLSTGMLNSFEKNNFDVKNKIVKKIQILIHNRDNQPLEIESIEINGFVYELVARFNKQANYFLTYGFKNANKPQYDISHFTNKIPNNLIELQLNNEQIIGRNPLVVSSPLFKSKKWLWGIMLTIILILGWFSFKMMKS